MRLAPAVLLEQFNVGADVGTPAAYVPPPAPDVGQPITPPPIATGQPVAVAPGVPAPEVPRGQPGDDIPVNRGKATASGAAVGESAGPGAIGPTWNPANIGTPLPGEPLTGTVRPGTNSPQVLIIQQADAKAPTVDSGKPSAETAAPIGDDQTHTGRLAPPAAQQYANAALSTTTEKAGTRAGRQGKAGTVAAPLSAQAAQSRSGAHASPGDGSSAAAPTSSTSSNIVHVVVIGGVILLALVLLGVVSIGGRKRKAPGAPAPSPAPAPAPAAA
jgi:hypothetical protein